MKTNGARILESLGIPFSLHEYEVDPDDLSAIRVRIDALDERFECSRQAGLGGEFNEYSHDR